mgnify:CR=1 FL=1|tara:strand:- start:297 stop:1001 length:705 start_codon:yes stop_codon:yes gene_type:complete
MNNNLARISTQRAQILFSLADTNNDGKLNMQEISQLFDRILLGAQIDPTNNYQGLGVVMQSGWDPTNTVDFGVFTDSVINWATTINQRINSAPNGTVFNLIDGNTITPRQARFRIKRVINHMDFEQTPVLPVAHEVVDPAQQNQNIPIAHIEPASPHFVGGRRTFKKSSQKTKKNKRKIPFSKKGKKNKRKIPFSKKGKKNKRKTRQKRKTRHKRKTRQKRKTRHKRKTRRGRK